MGEQTTTSRRTGPSSGRHTGAPQPRRLVRRLRHRVLPGDRLPIAAFLGTSALAVLIVSGPIQTWIAQRELVEEQEALLEVLEAENEALADRAGDLRDPATIEAEAREELGMYRPGEVPYVIVPPDVAAPQIAPDLTEDRAAQQPWWERVWDALAGLLD